jgi:DNA-binding NarL/FixJ family response regulator
MSGASQLDERELARVVPAAWRRFVQAGQPVAASASVRAGGAELPIDIVAQVDFVDERRLDVHLVLAEDEPGDTEAPASRLTRRQRMVVALIAQGLETREIADTLYVSMATVKTHVRHAMEKLGAHTRAQLVAVALTGHSADAVPSAGDRVDDKSPNWAIDQSPSPDDQ